MPWSSCAMRFVLSCLGPGYHSLRHTAKVAVRITDEIDLFAEILRWYHVNECGISLDRFPDALYAQVRSEEKDGPRFRADRIVDDFCWICRPDYSMCLTVDNYNWEDRAERRHYYQKFASRHTPGRHHSVRAFQGRYNLGQLWKYVGGHDSSEYQKVWWGNIEELMRRQWAVRHNSHECCKSRLRPQNNRSSGADATALQLCLYALEVTDCHPGSSILDRNIYLSAQIAYE